MGIVRYSRQDEGYRQLEPEPQRILLSNRLYVPYKLVSKKALKEFTYEIGEVCEGCDCSEPTSCAQAQVQRFEMWREKGDYLGFCRGDIGKLKRLFDWNLVDDRRSRAKMQYPLQFTGKLRQDQQTTVAEWMKRKYGILKSPPRSGKTVMLANIVCTIGYQTLILVHQDELADQFYKTFHNINDSNVEFTNAPDLERKLKKTVVGIARSLKDLDEDWPVTIMTYQKFIRHIAALKKMKNKWGMVVVDEAHLSSAEVWSKILNILNPKIRWGVTATPYRKDQTHIIAENVLGPVTAEGTSKQMVCEVEYLYTPHEIKDFSRWTTMINRICGDEDRNRFIAEKIAKDAENGRHILATTTRVKHAQRIGELLNTMGYKVAVITGAAVGRKDLLEDFKKGRVQILIASRQITQVGLDLPILDSLHVLTPNMNEYNYLQEVSRCRTYYEGKPDPLVRIYLETGHKVTYAIRAAFQKVHDQEKFKTIYDQNAQVHGKKKVYKGWGE